jgi:class 3 adenylate cyclase
LYANPSIIPGPEATRIAELVSEQIRRRANDSSEFDADIQGTAYRVFYQLLNSESAFAPAYQVCLFSLEEARRELSALRWKILGASAVALVSALLLSLLLAHGLAVPIRELVSGTGEIQRGNFEVKVPVRSRDELGQLAKSFNDMAEGLAQKERYRTVLNLVADEKIAQQLMSGSIKLGGEVRDVSVLFCDIRGFTAITENMPPAEVIEMLNEHMTALTQVVKTHNGVLDKFVGDLLMAVFGAPFSHGNDAFDAARCALQLVETREKLNLTSRHNLQVGIGVSSGEVVAGCMGSIDRLNYTVVGQRVNLASRLCSHAAGGEILIDQTTLERLGASAITAPAALLQLKGFCDPVPAHKLLSINLALQDQTAGQFTNEPK